MLRRACQSRLAVTYHHVHRTFAVAADLRAKIAANTGYLLDRVPNLRPKPVLLEQTLAAYAALVKAGDANVQDLNLIADVLENDSATEFSKNVKEDLLHGFLVQAAKERPSAKLSALLNLHLGLKKSPAKKAELLKAVLGTTAELQDLGLTHENLLLVLEYGLDNETKVEVLSRFILKAAKYFSHYEETGLKKLRYMLDQKLLSKCWSTDIGIQLFLNKAITYKLFMFLSYQEFGSIENFFNHMSEQGMNPDQISQLLSSNRLEFLREHRSSLGTNVPASATPLLTKEEAAKEFDLYKDSQSIKKIAEARKYYELSVTDITSDIKLMIINDHFNKVPWTLQSLLDCIEVSSLLKISEAEEFWKDKTEVVEGYLKEAKSDFRLMLECNQQFFSSRFLVDNYFYAYSAVLTEFLKEQLTPQHLDDKRTLVWERSLPELSVLADSLAGYRAVTNSDCENFLYNKYAKILSYSISDPFADPFLHPEFRQDYEEFLIFQQGTDEGDGKIDRYDGKVNRNQGSHKKGKKEAFKTADVKFQNIKPTDLKLGREKWLKVEPLVKVNTEFTQTWNPKTIQFFIKLISRMYEANLGMEKFIIAGQRAFENLIDRIPIEQYGMLLRLIADLNYVTVDLHAIIQDKLFKDCNNLLKKASSSLDKANFFRYVLDFAYYATLFKSYNQQTWNSFIDNFDIQYIEHNLQKLDNQNLILLGQIILITRMEAPYVRSVKFDPLMDYLVGLNQTEFDLFKPSQFSNTVVSLLKKFYYDFIKPEALAELFKVHILQNKHAVICLDDSHFVSSSEIVKGRVELALRLLKNLNFDTHIVSKKDYGLDEKRSSRLNYLKKSLVGLEINEKRKNDVENTVFFE